MGRAMNLFVYNRERWWTVVNVVMNIQVPYNARNVVCFLPGRAKDLSAPMYWNSNEPPRAASATYTAVSHVSRLSVGGR